MTHTPFQFFLFSKDPVFIGRAVPAGIDAIIVDWENRAKASRQKGYDTQIGTDTVEDLARVRASTSARVICRLNGTSTETPGEIEAAVGAGADDILLPMVRTVREVEEVLEIAGPRCGVGILVETEDSLSILDELGALPLSIVYVGLNDLCIERQGRNIFTPLIDGTVERIRSHFRVPFGFAGLTLPELGSPVPCRLLMGEMARLSSDFSFLRRSFTADIVQTDLTAGVAGMRQAMERAHERTAAEIKTDHAELARAVRSSNSLGPAR